jgi:hypothetical protein
MRTAAQLNTDLARVDPSIGPVFVAGEDPAKPLVSLTNLTGHQLWVISNVVHPFPEVSPAAANRDQYPPDVPVYYADWMWAGDVELRSQTYKGEDGLTAIMKALARGLDDGRIALARITDEKNDVLFDSRTGTN